jgi:penicillin-binding protein 1C
VSIKFPTNTFFDRIKNFFFKYRYQLLAAFLFINLGYYICLPSRLFKTPTSTVLFDKDGKLLGAKIANDGQWRFPHNSALPDKFAKAIICFEDKRFNRHWGVDFWAMSRALWGNMSSGEMQSGASTISMQVIRLSRNNPNRTVPEKLWEMLLATRMEWGYSKKQILAFYCSNAPFGANVVGLDAAAWKYFGRSADQLSWAEAAMLAVLPNSPSLINLGKNRTKLKAKRDRLLEKLKKEGHIDEMTCRLSKLEELPEKPQVLPRLAPHLLERVHEKEVLTKKLPNGIVQTTIDADLQSRVAEVLEAHSLRMSENLVYNAAALVIDAQTGDVLVYLGNTPNVSAEHGAEVDIITAPRSSGSILKPLLYASMLHDGEMLPGTIFPDIPSQFGAYTPKNFDLGHDGAVAAKEVISRSLNVPSVQMLYKYSPTRFHSKLKQLGMTTLNNSSEHYGLTLVLGGAETTLWDLGGIYSSMARNLWHYNIFSSNYAPEGYMPLNYHRNKSRKISNVTNLTRVTQSTLSAAAIWHTFEAMQEVGRPGSEGYWEQFTSSSRIAWKTGTSFGFRDAWAVGVTPRYVVAVWVGNADGEGRPGIVGVSAAGPLLFDIFHILGHSRQWFEKPYDDMLQMPVCRHSGHLAGEYCVEIDSVWIQASGRKTPICPYHKMIHLSADSKYRVHSECESPGNMRHESFFVLPPSQEWFYTKKDPSYQVLPPYREDCKSSLSESRKSMELIYPASDDVQIFVPRNLDQNKSRTVFEAAHSKPKTLIYWHLDDKYIGTTKEIHGMSLNPSIGKHRITLVDEHGESIERFFEVIEN